MNAPLSMPTDRDVFALAAALAAALAPLSVAHPRRAQLQQGLRERVRRSAWAHRDFSTVRREDGRWTACSPGVRQRALSAVGGLHVDLLTVQPHATLPWPKDDQAQELLVVDGTLWAQPEGSPAFELPPLSQLVVGRSAALGLFAGSAGATLYVRRRCVDLDQLPDAEARWWAAAEAAPVSAAGLACPWSRFLDGVDAAVLRAHGDVASMLIRIKAGATLPDHGHRQVEDCFMLEGEMFLGDILMRAGDYQLAPVTCRHVGIGSDSGGLFYFHGAVPPAASEAVPCP